MKTRVVPILMLLFLMMASLFACSKKEEQHEAGVYYTCPMHPEVKKEEAGQCPICGMDLVKKETEGHKH